MLNIAIFSDNTANQINGAAEVTRQLSVAFTRIGMKATVYCPDELCCCPSKPIKPIVFPSIPFARYPECRIAFPFSIAQIKNILELKPSLIVIATPFTVGLTGLMIAKLLQVPVVTLFLTDFSAIGHYYGVNKLDSFFWNYMRYFSRRSEQVYVPSQYGRRLLKSNGILNAQTFKLGTSSNKFRPLRKEEAKYIVGSWCKNTVNLLYVGRYADDKNIKSLINSVATLPHVRLNIVGDGPLIGRNSNRLPNNVSTLGYIRGESLANIYRSGDGFVMPSVEELGGMSIIEAFASGLPVLAFGGKASGELVEHGVNGLTFQTANQLKIILGEFSNHKILRNLASNISQDNTNIALWDHLAYKLSAYSRESKYYNINCTDVYGLCNNIAGEHN